MADTPRLHEIPVLDPENDIMQDGFIATLRIGGIFTKMNTSALFGSTEQYVNKVAGAQSMDGSGVSWYLISASLRSPLAQPLTLHKFERPQSRLESDLFLCITIVHAALMLQ